MVNEKEARVTTPQVVTNFNIEPFHVTKCNWNRWVKRLEGAFVIFDTKEEQKLQFLLHYMGPEAYDILCDKTAPVEPEKKTYKEVVEVMQKHWTPEPLEIAENFRFRKRDQAEGETIREYVTALQRLSVHCKFGAYLDTALRNQFVFGLRSARIQSRLLETLDLTFEKAVEKASSMEMTARDSLELHRQLEGQSTINAVRAGYTDSRLSNNNLQKKNIHYTKNNSSSSINSNFKCFRCGSTNHLANKCYKANLSCNFCKKRGHIENVCLKKKKGVKYANQIEENIEVEEIMNVNENTNYRDRFLQNVILNNKNVTFEIDSAAAVSLMTKTQFDALFPTYILENTDLKLQSYCQNNVLLLGYATVKAELNGRRLDLNLYVVDSDKKGYPLLGREWIRQLGVRLEVLQVREAKPTIDKLNDLLKKYNYIFSENIGKIKDIQASIKLKENAIPVFCKARPVPFSLLHKVEQEIDSLVQQGILVKVDYSEWATPVVPIQKSNGRVRLCGDFKITLNPNIHIDNHPLPTIDELFANMAGGEKFSKIDVSQAFLHMEIKSEDTHLVTLNTHKGLYKCTRLLYGLSSAPAIWQRAMESILGDIPGVSIFLDDIKITGKNDDEHLKSLELVLNKLQQYNIHINKSKCQFLQNRLEYCGYEIDKSGIHKVSKKIEAINDAKRPSNITELRAFLGLIQYYGRFFQNLGTLLYHLHVLLRNDTPFKWTNKCEEVFKAVKAEMQSDKVLAHYDPKLPIILATDASSYGVGAVISHKYPNGEERPIQFASQSLNNTQQKYSQIDKEAYAIIFGVRKFYQYLYGRKFILYTDHKPLLQIFNPRKCLPTMTATRMQHYALFLQSFDYEIRYKNTKCHSNADAMSRLPINRTSNCNYDEPDVFEILQLETMPVTARDLAKATESEFSNELKILTSNTGNTKKIFGIDIHEFSLQQGCILRGQRVIIPTMYRKRILNELHTGHLGMNKMKALARSYCWWQNIDKQLENVCKNCFDCGKNSNNPPKIHHPWVEATQPFQRVHIDFAGPFMGAYFLILVDAYTRWPEVHLINNITTDTTITILRKIFCTFGIPSLLVSDNGTQFTSYKFKQFLQANGIIHKLTAPYSPATNGLAERFVQTIKQGLRSMKCTSSTVEYSLSKFLLHYRKTPHSITKQSPSKLMFGREIKSRLDLITPQIVHKVPKRELQVIRKFIVKDRVAVRDYSQKGKWKFGTIIKRLGELHYLVELDTGLVWRRHVNQLIKIGAQTPRMVGFATVGPLDRVTSSVSVPVDNSTTETDIIVKSEPIEILPEKDNVIVNDSPQALRRSERIRSVPDRYRIDSF